VVKVSKKIQVLNIVESNSVENYVRVRGHKSAFINVVNFQKKLLYSQKLETEFLANGRTYSDSDGDRTKRNLIVDIIAHGCT
jgi:hypothetical protein